MSPTYFILLSYFYLVVIDVYIKMAAEEVNHC